MVNKLYYYKLLLMNDYYYIVLLTEIFRWNDEILKLL